MISLNEIDANHVKMVGFIAHDEAKACQQILFSFLNKRKNTEVTIDLSDLSSVSSITLSFLLSGYRAAQQAEVKLQYIHIPDLLFNMARVSGIESILVNPD